MDERLILHHTMMFYILQIDNKLPIIDNDTDLESFNDLQLLLLRSLVLCFQPILGSISLSPARCIQLHHIELHPYDHHQGCM